MRTKIIILLAAWSLAAEAWAWSLNGNNQADFWLSQPGYSLSYREVLDINLKGRLTNDLGIAGGIRYQQDEEVWADTATFRGISKKYLLLQSDQMSLKLGNYYAVLGRGLILNCVNDERVKLDRDIDGGYLKTGYGDWLEIKGLTGRAQENTARINASTYLGGQAMVSPWETVDIGGIYLRANSSDRTSDVNYNKPTEESFGGALGLRLWGVDYYGEYARRHTYGMLDPALGWIGTDDQGGKGFYSSIGWAADGIGAVLDIKDYRNMNSLVNAPPACNREGRLLNSAADEHGLQVDVTVSPWEFMEMHGNYSLAEADDRGSLWEDAYLDIRWELNGRWTVSAEARARIEDSLETEVIRRKYKGGGVEGKWRYGDRRALILRLDADKFNNLYIQGPLRYNEIRTGLSWVPSGFVNLYAEMEISDQRLPEYENQSRWGRAGAVINLGPGQKLEVSAGQNKGGLVCSGGYCRYEPPFKGFKTTWIWNF
jgi:hypothetical protein